MGGAGWGTGTGGSGGSGGGAEAGERMASFLCVAEYCSKCDFLEHELIDRKFPKSNFFQSTLLLPEQRYVLFIQEVGSSVA
ncbi:hypothetical protein Q6247_26340, partial [Klebsiella pneumoniae]